MATATDTHLPRLAEDARFVPVEELGDTPHIAVDCASSPTSVLALSHWPSAGTPARLAADTSAQIVERYLEMLSRGSGASRAVEAVTCDHYDEDGLLALWLLLYRSEADSHSRRLAVAAAEAGDFATWTDPDAARVAIACMRMVERETTPFPEVRRVLARGDGGDPAGRLYRCVLPRVSGLLDDPQRFRLLSRADWDRVQTDIALLEGGGATIEEVPEADLAIVRTPRPLLDLAVHPRTRCMRVLTVTPDRVLVLRHRYETWVDYVSRPLAPRVDLTPLARRLQALEMRHGTWIAQEMHLIRPMVHLRGSDGRAAASSIAPETFARELAAVLVEAGLRAGSLG